MLNLTAMADGDHELFISGNDAQAKERVLELPVQFGRNKESVIDLGNITTARGSEQLLPL